MLKLILALALPLALLDGARPDPAECSVCHTKPTKIAKAGIVSHGPFRFGRSDTKLVERIFDNELAIYWTEGKHVKLGFAATEFPYWPGGSDPARPGRSEEIRSLANGALAFKPFARSHAYVERAEETYARVQKLLRVEDKDFPRLDVYGAPIQPKSAKAGYMGEGPFLGQAAKYEFMILPGKEQYDAYITHPNGLAGEYLNQALIKDTDAISTAMHLSDGDLWEDVGVWGYMTHHLAHALLRGYKHQSYGLPPWLDAGFAHVLEREVSKVGNSLCGSVEVSTAGANLNDWTKEVKEHLRGKKRPYFEDMFAKETLSDFTLEDHLFAWSMVRFLIEKHPKAFALICADIKGLSKGKGGIGATTLRHAQQDAFARHLDMTYGEFDKAWSKWAKKQKKQG